MHKKIVFIVLLLALTPAAFAAPTMSDSVLGMYQGFFRPLQTFSDALVPGGKLLITALVVLHIAMGGFQLAAGTTDMYELAMKGLKLSFVASLVLACIHPAAWLGTMTGLNSEITLPMAILQGFKGLATIAAGTVDPSVMRLYQDLNSPGFSTTGGLDIGSPGMMAAIMDSIFNSLSKLLDAPIFTKGTPWYQKLFEVFSLSAILNAVFYCGTIFMFLLASAMMIAELIGAILTVAFALTFTPLMVPWLLFRPMEFLFNSWLKCIILGSIGFVVGVLMLSGFTSFVNKALAAMAATDPGSLTQGWEISMLYLPLFFGSFIFFILSPKVMNIASGLVSGGGVDGVSIHAFRQAMGAAGAVSKAPGQVGRDGRGVANTSGKSAANAAAGATAKGLGGAKAGLATAMAGGSFKESLQSAREGAAAVGGGNTVQSAGFKAASGAVAAAEARGLTPTPDQRQDAVSAGNAAYKQASFDGKSGYQATEAATKAAQSALVGAPKTGTNFAEPAPIMQPSAATQKATPFPKLS